jgi:uncharacterized repeat protein (TIGR01451 family)
VSERRRQWSRTYQVGVILLVTCILASCVGQTSAQLTSPSSTGTPSTVKQVVSEADLMLVDQLILNGKYEEAVLQLQTLQQRDPSNAKVQDWLRTTNAEWKLADAKTLLAAGGYEEALKKIKAALDLVPGDARFLAAMDQANLGLGKKYVDYLDAARAKEALLAVNHDQNLRLQAQSLLTLDVPAVEYTKKGYEALQSGDYTKATGYFKAALQLKPTMDQAISGLQSTQSMIASKPTQIPASVQPEPYVPPAGLYYPPANYYYPAAEYPVQAEPAPAPASEAPGPSTSEPANSWDKPPPVTNPDDWSKYKTWIDTDLNRLMSGISINQNAGLRYETMTLGEDPQAYNYLSDSDYASVLYLTALRIYGERALLLSSEIPGLLPFPALGDAFYQTAQKRVARLDRDMAFVLEGVSPLNPPTKFKLVQRNLVTLLEASSSILQALKVGGSEAKASDTGLLEKAQAYIDSFTEVTARVLPVTWANMPQWAQLKKYYIETGLYTYLLKNTADDYQNLMPLPQVFGDSQEAYSPAQTLNGLTIQLKSSTAAPKGGDTVVFTLSFFNTSTVTRFGTARVAIPPNVIVVKTGETGTFRVEDGESRIVWENLMIPPLQTITPSGVLVSKPTTQDFTLKIENAAIGDQIQLKAWLTASVQFTPTESYTTYSSGGSLSGKIGVTSSNPRPGDEFVYVCQVVNGGDKTAVFDLTIPIPSYLDLLDMGAPPAEQVSYGGQRAMRWAKQSLGAGGIANFSFLVRLQATAPIGTDLSTYANILTIVSGAVGPTPPPVEPISLPWVYFGDLLKITAGSDKNFVVSGDNVTITTTAWDITYPEFYPEVVTYVLPFPTGTTAPVSWTGQPSIVPINGIQSMVWPYIVLDNNSPPPPEDPDRKPFRGFFATLPATGTEMIVATPYVYLHGQPTYTTTFFATISSVDAGVELITPVQNYGPVLYQFVVDTETPLPGQPLTYTCSLTNMSNIPLVFSLKIPLPSNTVLIDPGAAVFGQKDGQETLFWPMETILPVSDPTAGGHKELTFVVQVLPEAEINQRVETSATFDLGTTVQAGTIEIPSQSNRPVNYNLVTFNTALIVVRITDPKSSPSDIQSLNSTLVLTVGTGAQLDFRPVLEELMRLQRITNQLQKSIDGILLPVPDISDAADKALKQAADDLASALIAIPGSWQNLENRPDLPNYDFVPSGYPKVTGTDTGTVGGLSGEQMLTSYGRPGDWKDLIEWLKALMLQRLAELGFQ